MRFRSSKGFSLVEILIALAILAIAAVMFNKFIVGTQRGLEFTEKHLRAYLLADHIITSLQIKSESSSTADFKNFPSEFSADVPVIDQSSGKFEDKLCSIMNTVSFSREASTAYMDFSYNIDFEPGPVYIDGEDVTDFYRPVTVFIKWTEKGAEKKIGMNTAIYVKR